MKKKKFLRISFQDSSLILTGKLMCGRPFKRTTNRQGWMEGISYKTEDAFNKDEIESMPSKSNYRVCVVLQSLFDKEICTAHTYVDLQHYSL